MIRTILLLVLFTTPTFASTVGWPALYDVIDVAPSDVLNVRTEPKSSTDIIGHYSNNATSIEVIRASDDGKWGLVNFDGWSGWVSLGYLTPRPNQWEGVFPEFAWCAGTEPFWGIDRLNGVIRANLNYDKQKTFSSEIDWESSAANYPDHYSFKAGQMTGVVARRSCNDGMSDAEYGLEIDLLLLDDGTHFTGCCSLQLRAR